MDTIAELLLARASDDHPGTGGRGRRVDLAPGGGGQRSARRLPGREPGPRAVPRGHPPRQRARARLVAGGSRPGRCGARGREPHAPGDGPGPGPGPHPVPAPRHRPGPSPPGRGPRPRSGHRHRVGRAVPASWWSTTRRPPSSAPSTGPAVPPFRGRGPRRRRGRARLPDLHVRDLGCAQGVSLHPGPPGPHRDHRGPDVQPHRRRRVLHRDAALPLQRADGGTGPGHRGGRHHRAAHGRPLLGVGVPRRRPAPRRDVLQLRGQAPVVHPGHAGAARRRRQPARAGLR